MEPDDAIFSELSSLIGRQVVLDTAGTTVYLGTLASVSPGGFWLTDADVHDCRDGHATPEVYVLNAATDGITPNRTRVFVLRSTILSISGLQDVLADFSPREGAAS